MFSCVSPSARASHSCAAPVKCRPLKDYLNWLTIAYSPSVCPAYSEVPHVFALHQICAQNTHYKTKHIHPMPKQASMAVECMLSLFSHSMFGGCEQCVWNRLHASLNDVCYICMQVTHRTITHTNALLTAHTQTHIRSVCKVLTKRPF